MEKIKIEMAPEEWGQVMMVLQGGVYRVVAPLLNSISAQIQAAQIAAQIQEAAKVPTKIGLVPKEPQSVEDSDVPGTLPAAE